MLPRSSRSMELSSALLVLGLALVSTSRGSGLGQSPVNIEGARARTLPPLRFRGHLDIDGELKLENTGRYAKVSIGRKALLRGGPLIGNYILDRCVIHWGPTNEEGSEHSLLGSKYSAELQLEHYSSKYKSVEEARRKPEGLAFVSIFLQAGTDTAENKGARELFRLMSRVQSVNQSVDLSPGALGFLGSALRSHHYLAYLGSTTESPYFETVTWIIFPRAITVSSEQIEGLRKLETENEKKKTGNCRELQPIEGREVLFALRQDQKKT